uniref:CDT1 Geminin-binding domain-containing protein n=1 Tax=Panagrolaimus superbus TaxID=310955 RepID=A0A914ZEQ8_9BILA
MSTVRRSTRLAGGSTPSSTITLTPKNSITRYGGVKRRLKIDSDDTPIRSKAAKLLSEDFVETVASESPFETPRKRKQINFSPVKFDDTSDSCAMHELTPPKSLFPSTPPKTVGFSTPVRSLTRCVNLNVSNGFDTPKSARRKLFDQDEISEKCDLFVSTFSSKTPKTIQSGFGTQQRIAGEGKYARLTSPVKNASNYELPKKYQQLFDVFERMERIIAIKKGRGERCVFEELKKNVERDTKKNFTKDMLAQILTVYPASYNVRLEEHRTFGMKTPGKKHDLVVEPNLKKDLESFWNPPSPQKILPSQYGSPVKLTSVHKSPKKNVDFIQLSPRKSPTKATPQLRQLHLANYDRLEPWRNACRKAIFKYKLLLPIFELHNEFLNKIGASKEDLENGIFHAKFNLKLVPDIIPSALPEPRKDNVVQTKLEPFLEKKKEFVLPVNAEATLSQFKSPDKKTHTPNGKVPLSPTKFLTGDTPKLTLYERVMLKQKACEAKLEPFKVEKERRRNQLELIKQTLLYHVWSYFVRIKPQSTTKLDFVLYRLAQDIKLTGGELTEHIELLCECASRFFIINTVGPHSTKYLRLLTHGENDYRNIMEIIEKEFKKCQ